MMNIVYTVDKMVLVNVMNDNYYNQNLFIKCYNNNLYVHIIYINYFNGKKKKKKNFFKNKF